MKYPARYIETAATALLLALGAALPVRCSAVDLLEKYPTTLTEADTTREGARSWTFKEEDIFRVSKFTLEVGKGFKLELGTSDVGFAHCVDGVVWVVLIPRQEGKLASSAAATPEPVAHVWLRFHPKEVGRLFPKETVFVDGEKNLVSRMRMVANGKFTSSWHVGMKAMIPGPSDMTVDVDTKGGPRRFFMVDTKKQKAEYVNAFEKQTVRLPSSS